MCCGSHLLFGNMLCHHVTHVFSFNLRLLLLHLHLIPEGEGEEGEGKGSGVGRVQKQWTQLGILQPLCTPFRCKNVGMETAEQTTSQVVLKSMSNMSLLLCNVLLCSSGCIHSHLLNLLWIQSNFNTIGHTRGSSLRRREERGGEGRGRER